MLPILLDAGEYELSAILGNSNEEGIAAWEYPDMITIPTDGTSPPVIPTIEFELP